MTEIAPVLYQSELSPHRSLPPCGFAAVMAVLAGASLIMSIGCICLGAWPVTGFFGLDVGLVYLAFRLSYRSANLREILRLTQADMIVERIGVHGERRRWRFEPAWLRLVFEEPDPDTNRLMLVSHGKSLALGAFLAPEQRRNLYRELSDALARWRAALTAR
jgi:uncharacterized membrane protein